MNKILCISLFLSIICIIQDALANEYILISTIEDMAPPIPCQIYRTDTKQQSLSLIQEISAEKGIRLVFAYPQFETLVLWRYAENNTGSLVIVDVNSPEEHKTVSLPFTPILGGYLVQDSKNEPLFASWELSDSGDQLHAYSVVSERLEKVQNVRWETARLQSANALRRGGGGRIMSIVVDSDSGNIFYYSGNFRALLPFRFDEKTLEVFRSHVRNFPGTSEKWAAIPASDGQTCIIAAVEKNEQSFYIFIYDRIQQTWKHLVIEGEEDHRVQLFGNWLLVQHISLNKETSPISRVFEGKYTFYHLGSNEQFTWQTDPQTEILGIWDNTILYRRGDRLFESQIAGTQIVGERVLCQYKAIQAVHWAFLAPSQATSLSTSDSEKEQHSQQVGTYLLAAAQERSDPPMPCTLYRTDAASQTLSAPLATIFPHRGIHQVTTHPLYRKLAVWREDDHQTGSLVIVDVDMPADRQTVSLPFAPTSGGAFLVHEDTPLVLSRAVSARHAEAYTVPLGADRVDRSLTHIQWNTAVLQGANALRGRRLRSVVVQFEPHTNQLLPFFYDDGDAILPFQFDEVTRQRFESFHTNVADMPGNTARLCVLRPYIQNQLPEKFPLLVYDKLTRTWRELAVEGAAFAVQVFGPWIVMQHVMPNQDDPDGLPTPTGDYTFTHLDRETPMHWQADDQTEVLGIWGATLLYRTGETVFEATIDEHDIIDSRPVCRDPAVQHVHWAFRLPSQGGEE